jgi:hypothetical protein
MNTGGAVLHGPVFMGSGLAASRRPGTTTEVIIRISYDGDWWTWSAGYREEYALGSGGRSGASTPLGQSDLLRRRGRQHLAARFLGSLPAAKPHKGIVR